MSAFEIKNNLRTIGILYILALYLAFAFQKLGGPEPRSDVSSKGYRKRPHAAQDTEEGLSDPKSARTNS